MNVAIITEEVEMACQLCQRALMWSKTLMNVNRQNKGTHVYKSKIILFHKWNGEKPYWQLCVYNAVLVK